MNRAKIEFTISCHQAQSFVKRHLLDYSPLFDLSDFLALLISLWTSQLRWWTEVVKYYTLALIRLFPVLRIAHRRSRVNSVSISILWRLSYRGNLQKHPGLKRGIR